MSAANPVASEIASQYLRLHLADSIGPVHLGRLIRHFGSIHDVLSANAAQLAQVEGIGERRCRAILEANGNGAVERELEKASEASVRVICWEDAEYPPQLRQCDDPPICLYVRGWLQPEDAVALAVVGARHCSRYGLEQAERFGSLLAGAGFTVVSGLARGVDGHAHHGALVAQGRTVAVLGNGVDCVYPPEHDELAERILRSGAIISEVPMSSPPSADSFPRRNRIIAGMCLGVVVIEAGKRSGALITARLAGEYNREVFAVPGRIDWPTAAGTNDLIRRGCAKLIASLEDVLDELGDVGRVMASGPGGHARESSEPALIARRPVLTADEQAVVDCLRQDDADVDAIVDCCALPAATVAACLTRLQLSGLVTAQAGGRFTLRRNAGISQGEPLEREARSGLEGS